MKPEKLPQSDYRFVERLLYQQKTHDTAIAELQAELDDMLPSCSVSVVPLSHGGTKPLTEPERIADKRLHSVRGKYLQEEIARRRRHQRAISEAMTVLGETECRLVYLHYVLGKHPRECWQLMKLEKSRWYEIKHGVVCKVAEFLGLA